MPDQSSTSGSTDTTPRSARAAALYGGCVAQNTNQRALTDRIVWIDCEMTGLSLTSDALIEVAALVTDYELNQLGDGVDLVVAPPAEALRQMDDFVRDMHTSSGLLDELAKGITLTEAEE